MSMSTTSTAAFDSIDSARTAIDALRAAGVPESAMSVIGADGTATPASDLPEDDRVSGGDGDERLTVDGEAHAMRGVIGGGVLGALLGVVAIALPGPGTIVAAGAIAAAGAGFLVGAGLGGLAEILMQHGVSPEDVAFYEDRIGEGGVLVSVSEGVPVDSARIDAILHDAGGMRSTASVPS